MKECIRKMEVLAKNSRASKAYKHALQSLNYGRFTEALAHFCVVGTLLPLNNVREALKKDVLLAFDELVDQQGKGSNFNGILSCYNEIICVFPRFEEIPHKIGCLFFEVGQHKTAMQYFEKSLEIDSFYTPAIMCLENINNYLIERWHFRMLNDKQRNDKFKVALSNAICDKQSNILDIGTGTGLLSVFAVQAGAENVYACDTSTTMCAISQKVMRANNMQGKISVINKMSFDLKIGTDIPDKISLLVSEIFDAGLFGEGVLSTLDHAWNNLLLPNGVVIPKTATVYFSLIQCPWVAQKNRVFKCNFETFNLHDNVIISSEEEYDDPYSSEFLSLIPGGFLELSEPQELLTVNFNNPKEINELLKGKTFVKNSQCAQAGSLDAIALWFELHLDEGIKILTSAKTNSCWEQAVFPLNDNLVLNVNSTVTCKFLCKDMLRLVDVSTSESREGQSQNRLKLPSSWVRKLNDAEFCQCLENAVKIELEKGRGHFIDMSPVPLGGILAAKLGAKEVAFTDEAATKSIIDFCKAFRIPFRNLHFLNLSKLTDMNDRYDCIIFDPVDLNGILFSGIFEDLALIRSVSMKSDYTIIPHQMRIITTLIDCPTIRNYTVTEDENVFGLKISEFINKYKTKFFEDFRLESIPYRQLSDTLEFAQIDFNGPVSQLTDPCPNITAKICEDGQIDALPFWFLFNYTDNDLFFSTHSAISYSHAALIPNDLIFVTKGQEIFLQPSYKHSIVFVNILRSSSPN